MVKCLLFLIVNLLSFSSFGETTYGYEIMFTTPLTANDHRTITVNNINAQNAFKDYIQNMCSLTGECSISTGLRKWGIYKDYIVTFNNGFEFRVSLDASGVEIITKKMTLDELKSLAPFIDEYIFTAAQNVGFDISPKLSHMHIGTFSAFEGNVTQFRNYLTFMYNHPELSKFIFGDDLVNAPTIGDLHNHQSFNQVEYLDKFKGVIANFDNGKYETVPLLAKAIQKQVYNVSYTKEADPSEKYQAVNLTRTVDYAHHQEMQTVEQRGIHTYLDANDMIGKTMLHEAIINYCKNVDGLIEPLKVPPMGKDSFLSSFAALLEDLNFNPGVLKTKVSLPQNVPNVERYRTKIKPHTESSSKLDRTQIEHGKICDKFIESMKIKNLLRFGY